MENSQLSKSRQTGSNEIRNERGMKIFQSVTLVFLALFWIGFAISYYRGIENNISTYGILILTFSLINQEVLFKGEKAQNKSQLGAVPHGGGRDPCRAAGMGPVPAPLPGREGDRHPDPGRGSLLHLHGAGLPWHKHPHRAPADMDHQV